MPSEPPVIHAHAQGIPIWRFGFTWLLDEAPDLVDPVPLQAGNPAPAAKVHPKKSWEIHSNRLGATTTRMPRTSENDYLPQEAIHLIDGDLQTSWCSRSQQQPDVEPVWIRLDLPVERTVERIVLRKRPAGGFRRTVGMVGPEPVAVEIGRAMAAELTIKLSRDGWHWETVFDGPAGDAPDRYDFEFSFPGRPAKQVWITGRGFPRVESWMFGFSIAEVEVYDTAGRNVALATTGTGVTVNSTFHGFGLDTATQRWLWPLHYYTGMKWARVGYHDDPVNWHWVEKERGVLRVDPEADQAITELVEHGVNVVLALGFGNRLYTQADPGRKLPQLWEWYFENPAPPTTPEALAAWGRYVRYMAEHFRDRVQHFEVWNEWNIPAYWGAAPDVGHYLAVARTAIPILREVCPDARIMLGSWAGFPSGISTWSREELAEKEQELIYLAATHALATEVDEIGWHPFYSTDPDLPRIRNYKADVLALQAVLQEWGFRGHCMVTEWNYAANYPGTGSAAWWGDFNLSEIEKAKMVARVHVQHTALGLESFFCELFHTAYPMDLSLTRKSFVADPVPPHQPQAALYVTRNLGAALEDLEPAAFSYRLESAVELDAYPMSGPQDDVLALWQPGRPHDACEGVPVDVWLARPAARVTGYEPLNGTLQPLVAEPRDGGTLVRGVLVRDYPLLVRFGK